MSAVTFTVEVHNGREWRADAEFATRVEAYEYERYLLADPDGYSNVRITSASKQAVRAARAAANPTITGRWTEVAPAPLVTLPFYAGRARKAPRLTSTQRDSTGRVSDWSRSPYAPRLGWR
jgi:hypothetical protein